MCRGSRLPACWSFVLRIGLDVMGGDHAPGAILEGALAAVDELDDADQLVLIGDEATLRGGLEAAGLGDDPRFDIEATTQVIEMCDSPVKAIREKTDSSIVRMGQLGRAKAGDAFCDAIISAGNTGACVATAQMFMRRLPGVTRPGIAVTIPTLHGPVVLIDVGANPEPRPSHLHQYAHMAAVYATRVIGIEQVKIAVMNIGGEEGKGTPLVRETHQMCREDASLKDEYIGFVEGRELFEGRANVVVTEGFTGNVVLKLAEGLSSGLFKLIGREIASEDPQLAQQFTPIVKRIAKKHDYHEFGGAPLLGVNGICMIAHGSSEARTIRSAVASAVRYGKLGVNEAIVQRLKGCEALTQASEQRDEQRQAERRARTAGGAA